MAHPDFPTQPPSSPTATIGTTQPPAALVLCHDPEAAPGPAPACCPCCGRPYNLFDHNTSRLLDLVLITTEALQTASAAASTLKSALEEELP